MLIFLAGGARNGKSQVAVTAAAGRGTPVTFVATATAGDDETARRIDRRQQDQRRRLEIMRDSRIGTFGAPALILVILGSANWPC